MSPRVLKRMLHCKKIKCGKQKRNAEVGAGCQMPHLISSCQAGFEIILSPIATVTLVRLTSIICIYPTKQLYRCSSMCFHSLLLGSGGVFCLDLVTFFQLLQGQCPPYPVPLSSLGEDRNCIMYVLCLLFVNPM